MKGKTIKWSEEKNEWLKENRSISFEIIIDAIESGKLLDNIKHPNSKKYPNQFILVIEIENYIYLTPYVINENEIFLKTIIPSRKMTKKYLSDEK